jgi:hypothetical protein
MEAINKEALFIANSLPKGPEYLVEEYHADMANHS